MEKICYNWVDGFGSLRVEHSGRLSLDLGGNRCQSGSPGTIAGISDACRGNPGFAFSDYYAFALFQTVVSGQLDLRAYFNKQFFMGGGNISVIFVGQKDRKES